MRIKKVSEADFDAVVKDAGGSRINEQDSADYILNEAVIELKLAEEEGFEVRTRQEKIAAIFKRQQPQSPVVVIRPNSLNEADKQAYYNAVRGPLEDDVEEGANTSNIEHAYVALTFPALSDTEWSLFKKSFPNIRHFQSSYKEWLEFLKSEEINLHQLLEPFVPVPIKFEEFLKWVSKPISDCQFSDVCKFATELFHLKGIEILKRSREKAQMTIVAPESIYLVVSEIGQDEANDLSSIYYISEIPGFDRKEVIIENEKMFFSRAMSLATSYAIKRNVDVLIYSKQRL